MTKRNQTPETAPAVLETAAANLPANINTAFDAIAALEAAKVTDLIEVSGELLKLEAGESFTGIMTNTNELMEAQEEGKQPFLCVVMYAKNKSKVLCADAVVISAQRKIFGEANLNAANSMFKAVRLDCHGMKKSASNAMREYRDIKVFTA
jgi:hypothetical protein